MTDGGGEAALLEARDLRLVFPRAAGGELTALFDVSFSLAAGERLGVVGESGAGKSLLANFALINLLSPRRGALSAGKCCSRARTFWPRRRSGCGGCAGAKSR